MGITASASLAISLGPITAAFTSTWNHCGVPGGGRVEVCDGVMLLLRGEVSLLGIVSASISLLLEVQYDTTSGQLIGHGRLSISIEICWCFTLEINADVMYTVGEGNQSSGSLRPKALSMLASNFAERTEESRRILAAALPARPTYEMLVQDYVNMLA